MRHIFANFAASVSLLLSVLNPAHAQSSLTMYGRINLGVVDYVGYGPGGAKAIKENNFSSRFGFKGIEDLGDGLAANFVLESSLAPDTGDSVFGGREATVGLQGGFGKIRLGFMLTPLDDLHPIAGPSYLSSVTNDNQNGFWANGYSNQFSGGTFGSTACKQVAGTVGNINSFGFDNRGANSIRYDSPHLGGWNMATQYSFGEVKQADGCNAYMWSNKLQYLANGLNVALAYNLNHEVRGVGLDDSIVMLAGAYRFNDRYYLGAYYQTLKYANPGLNDLRQDGWGMLGRAFLGVNILELAWYHAGKGRGDQTPVFSGIFVGDSTESNLYILGYRYVLSRRTELWTQLAQVRDSSNAGYDLGGAGAAGGPGTLGQHPTAFAVGIKHDF